MLKKLAIRLIILIVLVLVVIYFARNVLVEWGIEEGSSRALGVEVDLNSADVGLSAGSLTLNEYEVRNPDDYRAVNLLSVQRCVLDVDAGSIFTDFVVVDSLVIANVKVNLEQKGNQANFAVLLSNIKKLDVSSTESEQRIRIRKVSVHEIDVTAKLSLIGRDSYDKSFRIKDITLKDIGGKEGESLGKVTADILNEIIKRSVAAGRNELPDGFAENIPDFDKKGIEKIGSDLIDRIKDVGSSLLGSDE